MTKNQEKELFSTLAKLVNGVNIIQTDVSELKTDVREIKVDLKLVKSKVESITEKIMDHETRLRAIESERVQ